jgi:DHA1 family bicyclomycin/chloramphenicol resistance-like MFS transporter
LPGVAELRFREASVPHSAIFPIPPFLPLLLGFLQAVGPISTDMYLPAFPAIEASFHTLPGSAQITLAVWLLSLAVGQLLQGALSDRFGRRAPLLIGTIVYIIGSVGCATCGGIPQMAAWRALTAIGASASMVIPRAIVRDITHGHASARLMSQLILVLGAAPILAPSLGGLVLRWANWRDIFWINAAYGVVALLAAFIKLPDTLALADHVPFHPISMLRRYAHVLTERSFATHGLMIAFYAFGVFAYLGGSPTIFIDHYHLSPAQFGLVFGGIAAGYILASQLNMRVVRRLGLDGTLSLASTLYLACATLLLALAVMDVPVAAFGLVLAATHCFNGILAPTATVGALRHHAAHAGSASAVLGTMQFGIGSTAGFIVGWLTDGTAVPMAALILFAGVAAKTCDLLRPPERIG